MSNSRVEDATPKMPPPIPLKNGLLHQRRGFPSGTAKLVVGGAAFVIIIGFFTLYSKKKPEASAIDIAYVTSGVGARPEHTRSGK